VIARECHGRLKEAENKKKLQGNSEGQNNLERLG
jgi:hypothetical protein